MRKDRRRNWLVLAAVAAATVLGGQTALGAGPFEPTIVLRTPAGGRALIVSDVATSKANVGVVWQEEDASDGDSPRIRYKMSTDGGDTFTASEELDDRDSQMASADICDGYLWMAYSVHLDDEPSSTWDIILDGEQLDGSGTQGALLTDPMSFDNQALYPDVACVGSRRTMVAWVQEEGFTDSMYISMMAINPDFKDPPPEYSFGPINADSNNPVSVAATGHDAYVAWVRDDRIRVKHYDVGPGPDSIVTANPTVLLPDMLAAGGTVRLAANGANVIVAYTQHASVFVRVSHDYGATFGSKHKVLDVPYPSEVAGFARSIDMRGSYVEMNITVIGGEFELTATEVRAESSNTGTSWSHVNVTTGGERYGGLTRVSGDTRLVEAWDTSWDDSAAEKLRFHRES